MERFKFLEHTADAKFQAYGKDLEECFENAALGLFRVMYDGEVKGKIEKEIEVEGKDLENLLYNFLEELLFIFETEGFFLKDSNVKIIEMKNKKENKRYKLKARLRGDLSKNYDIELDVKAITYNEMFVKKENNKWVCQVVVDV